MLTAIKVKKAGPVREQTPRWRKELWGGNHQRRGNYVTCTHGQAHSIGNSKMAVKTEASGLIGEGRTMDGNGLAIKRMERVNGSWHRLEDRGGNHFITVQLSSERTEYAEAKKGGY